MCLKINRLLFCDDTGACTMKLFVQYQLTICNFLLGVRRGGDMLNADHVTGIGTRDGSSKLICTYEVQITLLTAEGLAQWYDLCLPTLRSRVPFPVLPRVEYLATAFPAKVHSAFHPSEVGKMSTSMHGLLRSGCHWRLYMLPVRWG